MSYSVLLNNETGNIQGYSKFEVKLPDHGNFSIHTLLSDYDEIFEKINEGKAYLSDYRLEITDSGITLFNWTETKFSDPEYGKLVPISFNLSGDDKKSVALRINSIDNRPCLVVEINDYKTLVKSIDLHFTGKDDVNCHYESFYIDVEELIKSKKIVLPFLKINYEKLWANDFSIYYRKVFDKIWYTYK